MRQKNIYKIQLNLYCVLGSLVERQHHVCVQIQGNPIFLNLVSLFAENASKLLEKIRQNMNVRMVSNRT